jgi:hypothetical protein
VVAAQLFLIREAIVSLAAGLPAFFSSSWPLVGLGGLAMLGALWAFSIYRFAVQGVRK